MKLKGKGCCNCNDGTDCGLECRSRVGSAALCGFPEYVPGTPPRAYRTRLTKGSMESCFSARPTCAAPDCPTSQQWSGTDTFGFIYQYQYSGSISPTGGAGGGFQTYKVQGTVDASNGNAKGISPRGVGFFLNWPGGSATLNSGDSVSLPTGVVISVWFASFSILTGWSGGGTGCIASDGGAAGKFDLWALTENWNKDTCARGGFDDSACAWNSWKCPSSASDGDPASCPASIDYGGATVTLSATEKRVFAAACWEVESGIASLNGEIVAALSNEDTTADAQKRALAQPGGWSGVPAGCWHHTAWQTSPEADTFGFAFRAAQTRAGCGTIEHPLIVGHGYSVTIGLYRRPLGAGGTYLTSGIFLPYGIVTIGITATKPQDFTDWIDLPSEPGWETAAGSCSIVDLMP